MLRGNISKLSNFNTTFKFIYFYDFYFSNKMKTLLKTTRFFRRGDTTFRILREVNNNKNECFDEKQPHPLTATNNSVIVLNLMKLYSVCLMQICNGYADYRINIIIMNSGEGLVRLTLGVLCPLDSELRSDIKWSADVASRRVDIAWRR